MFFTGILKSISDIKKTKTGQENIYGILYNYNNDKMTSYSTFFFNAFGKYAKKLDNFKVGDLIVGEGELKPTEFKGELKNQLILKDVFLYDPKKENITSLYKKTSLYKIMSCKNEEDAIMNKKKLDESYLEVASFLNSKINK